MRSTSTNSLPEETKTTHPYIQSICFEKHKDKPVRELGGLLYVDQ